MGTGWSHPQRWTRSHERLILAWAALHHAHARRGIVGASSLADWLERRWGMRRPILLTIAQARHARRQLNAWRGGIEGYVAVPKFVPTASNTATGNFRATLRTLLSKGEAPARRLMSNEARA